jgi:UDP-N-acetylmuramate-alanine ligase
MCPFDTIAHALGEFSGAERRFQFKGEEKGVTVVDDYGIIRRKSKRR